jgi:hypothetical protein
MCFSCHIQTYNHSSRHSSISTWQSTCYSFPLVIATRYYLQAICSYTLDFSFGYFKGDLIPGIGYLLFRHSKPLYHIGKHSTDTLLTLCANQNKTNLNELIQYILQITSNLSHMFCASRPFDSSVCFFRPFLRKRFSNSLLGTET